MTQRKIVFTAGCKTAMPTSWRAYDDSNVANDYECVILPQSSSRRRYYEVLTYGTHFGNYERLADAKAGIEEIYGPVNWTRVRLPLVEVEHYFYGPTTEFTDPLLVYAADLPRLGGVHEGLLSVQGGEARGPVLSASDRSEDWPSAEVERLSAMHQHEDGSVSKGESSNPREASSLLPEEVPSERRGGPGRVRPDGGGRRRALRNLPGEAADPEHRPQPSDRGVPGVAVRPVQQRVGSLQGRSGTSGERCGVLAQSVANLGTRLWWRVHPEHREFMPETATSIPFFPDEGERPQPGFSALDDPWHLWLYIWLMWGWEGQPDQVIGFTGQRVGEGNDGEALVMPDGGTVLRYTKADFFRELLDTPFPETPVFAPWVRGSIDGHARSWEALGARMAWLDRGDPVEDHIARTFAPQQAVAAKASGEPRTAGARGDLPSAIAWEVTFAGDTPWRSVIAYLHPGGPEIGRLDWFPTTGEVLAVHVQPQFRRRGVATFLWEKAKEVDPNLKHSHAQTPDGRAWAEKTAGANGDLPEGYTFEVKEESQSERWGYPVLDIRVRFEGKEIAGLGVFQRLHPGDSEPTAHPNIWVDEEHRRKGIATAMYAEVRRRWPGVPIEHSEHASDAAKALNRTLDPRVHRTEKTAGAEEWMRSAAKAPEGVTYEFVPTIKPHSEIGQHTVRAMLDGEKIGVLSWFAQNKRINNVFVKPEYRRMGLATEMLRVAREHDEVLHNENLTPDGYYWSQAVGSKTAGTLTLYRGEGSHDRPSYYPAQSGEAGGWWTTDRESAERYARSTQDGKVYVIEVDESEVERRGLPQYRFIPDPEVRKRRRLLASSKTAAYDGTLIARGLTVGTEGDDKVLAQKLLAGTVTAQDMIHLLERHDGRVGIWWGVMGTYGDLSDFEDHAFASEDLLLANYIEPDEDWWGGEVQVVLVAKRPTRDGQPWDPEWHNPPEAGGLMGNSYLADNEQVELVEVRYNAGLGWKSLPAQGIRVTASQPTTYYHVTSYSNWPSIRDNGLRPGSGGHVWLFTEVKSAMWFKDSWHGGGWEAPPPPEQWRVPPCIVVVRTDRAVPTEAGIPGAYWVEGPVTKDEVYDVIRPEDLHHYAAREA